MKNRQKQKKVLFTSHTANFSKFNRPFMRWFHDQGYEVHYASAGEENVQDCDRHFTIQFDRSPWSPKNIFAYRQMKAIINREDYDLIHTHTPMGGVITRLAARKARKHGTKVIYTAHGFHFYKGSSIKSWLFYFSVEKLLSLITDEIITLNEEDYQIAKKRFYSKKVKKINGVGVSLDRFRPADSPERIKLRKKHDISNEDFVLIYVAEFIPRKDHQFIIRSAPLLKKNINNLKIIFAGIGIDLEKCKTMAERLGCKDVISFLGYRNDVEELYRLSDLLVSSSFQEGLPINIIEGMASGLPIVCASIRGQTDTVIDGENGLLYKLGDSEKFELSVFELYNNRHKRETFGVANVEAAKKYSLDQALSAMAKIYKGIL